MSKEYVRALGISENIFDLTGKGEEWLICKTDGRILAKFFNGVIQDTTGHTMEPDEDATLILNEIS